MFDISSYEAANPPYVEPEDKAGWPMFRWLLVYCTVCGTLLGQDNVEEGCVHATIESRFYPELSTAWK
jgi:hypothetical protein